MFIPIPIMLDKLINNPMHVFFKDKGIPMPIPNNKKILKIAIMMMLIIKDHMFDLMTIPKIMLKIPIIHMVMTHTIAQGLVHLIIIIYKVAHIIIKFLHHLNTYMTNIILTCNMSSSSWWLKHRDRSKRQNTT